MKSSGFHAILMAAIILVLFGALGVAADEYPFSDVIPWDKKSERQEYDRLLRSEGFNLIFFQSPQINEKVLAKNQQCFRVEKNSKVFGYGIVYERFLRPALIVNKQSGDRREIDIKRAEILYDMAGRRIFLVSYRTRLSKTDMFFAKFVLGKEVEANRKIFNPKQPLGDGYDFDDYSRKLVEDIWALSLACKF